MASSTSVTSAMWDDAPLTVEEIVLRYRRLRRLNKNLCACIDSFRAECNKLADSSPCAAQALRNLLPVDSLVESRNSSLSRTSAVTAAPTAVAVEESEVSRSQSGVLEGVVVKQNKCQHVLSHSILFDSSKSRSLIVPDDTTRDYKEEYNVLRLKLMGMESSQQLLVAARQGVEEQKKRCAAYASSLDICREELAKSRSQCQFLLNILTEGYHKDKSINSVNISGDDNKCTTEEEADRVVEDLMTNIGSVDSISTIKGIQDGLGRDCASRLSLAVRVVQTEVALQEAQAAVNSLKATVEQLSYDKDQLTMKLEALTVERDTLQLQNNRLEGQVQRVLLLVHEDRSTQQNDEKISLQSERIGDYHDMTPSHKKMIQQLKKLQEENHSLQQSVLRYQRQVNDAELHAEEMAADHYKKDEEIQALREEVTELRGAIHEKRLALQQTSRSWQSAKAQWGQLDRVHRTVIEHMSRRLLLQVCSSLLSARGSDESKNVVAERRLSASGERNFVEEFKMGEVQKLSVAEGTMIGEVPVALSTEGERVKELLEHIESLESEHRSVMKHWHQANHELRTALATSQEELRQKEDYIRVLEQRQNLNMKTASMFESQYDSECQIHYVNKYQNYSVKNNSTHEVLMTQEYDMNQILPDKWRLLQVENEDLHQQVFALTEKCSTLNLHVDEYRERCGILEREIKHNAETMNELVTCGFISTTNNRVHGSADAVQIRNLQSMLQCVLKEKMELLTKLKGFEVS